MLSAKLLLIHFNRNNKYKFLNNITSPTIFNHIEYDSNNEYNAIACYNIMRWLYSLVIIELWKSISALVN